MSNQTMIHGDCLDEMRKMADNSIDFIVTDPPYGLFFMNKGWDNVTPGVEFWREAKRIAKPGSPLCCFGGTRTCHKITSAIEEAGWEIRDLLMWLYGSGFPKSHNFGRKLGDTWTGYGTALKPAYEPIILAMKPLDGTFKENAEKWGVAGLNIDDCRLETNDCLNGGSYSTKGIRNPLPGDNRTSSGMGKFEPGRICKQEYKQPTGRWPSNLLLDESAAAQLDEMTGILKSGGGDKGNKTQDGGYGKGYGYIPQPSIANSGGASRFFYCAKASSRERNARLEGMPIKPCGGLSGRNDGSLGKQTLGHNSHPTVKPIALMKYILKLLAPPGNPICLDPFAGSGSTLLAAKELGINCIGIEKEEEYYEIAKARLA